MAARDFANILPFVKNPRGFHDSWGGRVLRGVPPTRVDYIRIWGVVPDNGLLDYPPERVPICKREGRYPIDYLLRRSRLFFSLRGDQNGNQDSLTALAVEVPQIEAVVLHLKSSFTIVLPAAALELEDQDQILDENDSVDSLPAPRDRVLQQEVPVARKVRPES